MRLRVECYLQGRWGGITRGWDTITGVEKFRLTHGGKIDGVVYNQSGSHAAVRVGSLIRVWHAQTATKVAEFTHDAQVQIWALSSDGRRLATVTDASKTVHVWDVAAGKELYQLAHEDFVSSVIFSADDTLLITGGKDHTARVWDSAAGKQLARFAHNETVKRVTLSADNAYLAVTTEVSSSWEDIHIWHLPTKRQIAWLPHDGKHVEDMSFQPGHRVLATTDDGSTVRLWDPQSARIESLRLDHEDTLFQTVISPDSKRLAARINRDKDHYAPVSDLTTGAELFRVVHEDYIDDIAFNADGTWLATASQDRTARVWDATNGHEILRLPYENKVQKVRFKVEFSPRGSRLATYVGQFYGRGVRIIEDGLYDYTKEDLLQVWDVSSGKPTALKIQGYVRDFAFDPAGERLATVEGIQLLTSRDKLGFFGVRIWSVTSGKEILRLPHADSAIVVAFSPDGGRLVTFSYDHPVRFWDLQTGTLLQEIAIPSPGKIAAHKRFVLSQDWAYLAARTNPQLTEVQIWDVATGKPKASLVHEKFVDDIVFSPDSRYLATRDGNIGDGTVRVWDWMQEQPLVQLTPGGSIYDLRFTPDGSRVVTAGDNRTVRLWLWRTDDLIADACTRLERNLTHEEWRTFLGDKRYDKGTCPNLPVPGK